jgi:hypothetical protein
MEIEASHISRTAVLEKGRVEPAILSTQIEDDEAQRRNGPKTVMQSRRRKRRIGFIATRPVMLVTINCGCIDCLTKSS